MKRIDTHCHLWKEEISRKTWLDPEWEPWYRTFDIDDLRRYRAGAGIEIPAAVGMTIRNG